jgi:DNA polymerase III subunit epsilon
MHYGESDTKRTWRMTDMFKWQLDRPLAVLDIEATGINPRADRIVELAVVKLLPRGDREVRTFRVNPEMPIPPEATAIHGITDQDVASAPSFRTIAPDVYKLFDGCDLAGYNVIRFDVPLLIEEFLRASINFSLDERRVVDAQRIYHKREPRDLKAALAFYCSELFVDGHRAEADALATVRVFEGQFMRYPDLPRNMADLDKYCSVREPAWADRDGKLKWVNGEITINFGKKKGESLAVLAKNDPNFLRWILKSDFSSEIKGIVGKVLEGKRIDPIGAALGDKLTGAKDALPDVP